MSEAEVTDGDGAQGDVNGSSSLQEYVDNDPAIGDNDGSTPPIIQVKKKILIIN